MHKVDLFPSSIWKTKIDPLSYDKIGLLDLVKENYSKDPNRNNTGAKPTWNLHHYMYDWDNDSFQKPNLQPMVGVYGEAIKQFITELKLGKDVKYRYSVTDITVSSTGQNLKEHDHFYRDENYESTFSCVHYIKFNKDVHPLPWFNNPLMFSQYNENTKHMRQVLDKTNIEHSSYYEEWSIPIEEDDFIIFPAWLKHGVHETKTEELRVSCVVNIEFEIDTKKWLT